MSNKKIINKVFDQEFDIDTMRNQILLKKKKQENKVLKYVIPACMIGIISGLLILNSSQSKLKSDNKEQQNHKNNIIVNELENLGTTSRLDTELKQKSTNGAMIPWPKILIGGINIPSDLDKSDAYALYTRKEGSNEYDILNCYVYNYFKENSNKKIRIAFSDTKKIVKDYSFNEETVKKTNINNTELIIYQYEELYFTKFEYKNYNFDIETVGISIEELKLLLESILR